MSDAMRQISMNVNRPSSIRDCERHGQYMALCYLGNIWTKCPQCTAEEAEKQRQADEQEAQKKRLADWQKRIGSAGIPERFQDRSLRSFVANNAQQRQALAFATEYADGFDDVLKTGRSAIFVGRPGTGKTHLAVGIGLRIMHRDNRTVLFSTVMRAIRRVKDTWSRESKESESQAIAALVFPDLLILDEVGVQFGSEAERLILFDVLNERYEKRKPTLLISNLSLDEIKAFLGERIYDRLREDGGRAISFDWDSYRGKAAA